MLLHQSLRRHPVTYCAHCAKPVSVRRTRRRLCRRCYGSPADGNTFPGVRAQYCQTGSLASLHGEDTNKRDFAGPAPLPPRTQLDPGPAKVSVLQARAKRRQALFRPDDPSFPVHMPDPAKDWNALWLWRLLIALNPAIAEDLEVIGDPSSLDALGMAGVA
jgi:hypothetical protein